MPDDPAKFPTVFVAYSSKNHKWYEELSTLLGQFVQAGKAKVWSDHNIPVSTDWDETIRKSLRECDIAVLFISREFLANTYITQTELPELLVRWERGKVRLFLTLINSGCILENFGLDRPQFAHEIDEPLDLLRGRRREEALHGISRRFQEMLKDFPAAARPPAGQRGGSAPPAAKRTQAHRPRETWEKFGARFEKFIRDHRNGILLNADAVYQQQHGTQDSPPMAVFELTSGRFVKEFVTIWELFDHRDFLERCIDALTNKARKLHAECGFSAIVTTTATGRELGARLRARLRARAIAVRHIHLSHPDSGAEIDATARACSHEVALLLTDVVATGMLMSSFVRAIADAGGAIGAILAVTLTDPEHIRTARSGNVTELRPLFMAKPTFRPPLHFLSAVPIEPIAVPPVRPEHRISIDYETVLPTLSWVRLEKMFRPLRNGKAAFLSFDKAKAARFGLFRIDGELVTTAFDLKAIFGQSGSEDIWPEIRTQLEPLPLRAELDNAVLLSSYRQDDLDFKFCLEDWLKREWQPKALLSWTLKRDTRDSSLLYSAVHPYWDDLRGKHVIITIASNNNAEEMQSIVGLISTCLAKSVTIVCLFSRMGPFTSEFIARVRGLSEAPEISGQTRLANPAEVLEAKENFEFISVFGVQELASRKLEAGLERLREIFKGHAAFTRVPEFRRMSLDYFNKFETELFAGDDPAGTVIPPLSPDAAAEFQTAAAAAGWYMNDYAEQRDFSAWIGLLSRTGDRRLLRFVALLVSVEAEVFKINGTLSGVYKAARHRLDRECTARFDRETSFNQLPADRRAATTWDNDAPLKFVHRNIHFEVEMRMLIAVVACFDDEIARELDFHGFLTCGRSLQQWGDAPINCMQHFENERVAWSVSLLLYAKERRRAADSRSADAAEVARGFLVELRKSCSKQFAGVEARGGLATTVIRNNLGSLLREIGSYRLDSRADIIRYLHTTFLSRSGKARDSLRLLEECHCGIGANFNVDDATNELRRKEMPLNVLKNVVRCRFSNAALADGLDCLRELAFISAARARKAPHLFAQRGEKGTVIDLERLEALLRRFVETKGVSYAEFQQFSRLVESIARDVRGEESGGDISVRALLEDYIVPVGPAVAGEIDRVEKEQLAGTSWEGKWRAALERSSTRATLEGANVLADAFDLRFTVRSLLLAMPQSGKGDAAASVDGLRLDIVSTVTFTKAESEEIEAWCVEFELPMSGSEAEGLLHPGSVLCEQRARLQAFDGDLKLSSPGDGRAVFSINLISRDGYGPSTGPDIENV